MRYEVVRSVEDKSVHLIFREGMFDELPVFHDPRVIITAALKGAGLLNEPSGHPANSAGSSRPLCGP